MASHIDWYLIELDRRLQGRMSAESLFSLTSEVEDHLRLKKADLTAAGMESAPAERAAVESFGRPDDVALEALDGGMTEARFARFSWLAGTSIGAIWIAAAIIACTGSIPEVVMAVGSIIVLATLVFVFASARARKWHWRKILLISGPGIALMTLLLPVGFRPVNGVLNAKYWIASDTGWQQKEVIDMETCRVRLESGLAYYRQLDKVKSDLTKMSLQAPKDSSGNFIQLPTYWDYDPAELGAASAVHGPRTRQGIGSTWYGPYGPSSSSPLVTKNLSDAKSSWLSRGPEFLNQTLVQQSSAQMRLGWLEEAQKSGNRYSMPYVLYGLGTGAAMTAGMLFVNGVAVLLAGAFRRWRIRRPLVA